MPTASSTATEADPFFSLRPGSEWNACVGKQGAEINYVDGYIEAAIEMANAILDKRLYDQRDTLVLPILYNARHGVELALKFATRRLVGVGVLPAARPQDHDIKAEWELLAHSNLGDEALCGFVSALAPYVASLASIDDDGQELRYARTRDGKKSLDDVALVNIEVVLESLVALSKILDGLKYRVLDILDERTTGSFTSHCSRRDLLAIAQMIPARKKWTEAKFDDARDAVMARFAIGRRQFSHALKVIEAHREMGALIGLEFPLAHLSDEHLLFVIQEWTKLHSPGAGSGLVLDIGALISRDWEKMQARHAAEAAVQAAILEQLGADELADLEAIYYLGRGREFSERYADMIAYAKASHPTPEERRAAVAHLLQKTNLGHCLAAGVARLGRPSLVGQIQAMRPDVL